ncbi:MAG: Glu-tRNA(Gln) amidotransferase subunit GatE [Pseudomonadota bacterium]
MNSVDYQAMGFKCGVEIHQQLLTSQKLFCRCPAGVYSKKHDAEILRHMRPTLSEMGTYDGCALMEFKTKKEILYFLNKESVCTYEMDDTPPFPINQEALDIAIAIGLLLNCQIVDEVHVARKQYLDGSIPTGFQRTAIIGINGYVEIGEKKIRVRQLSIEEDSCREISDRGHLISFRTDRLGMPLIEVVTEPDFATPSEAAAGVKAIGRLLRATKQVRRGIGAVRQDVNVSIAQGQRVEIKGVPRYQDIALLTHIEALRQKALLELRDELKRRGLNRANLNFYEKDITSSIKNTRSEILKQSLEKGHLVRGVKVENFAGLFNWKTQPGKTFANEISGRVRVVACLDNVPNLFHTDHYPDYHGSHIDLHRLLNLFQVSERDALIITWGPKSDTLTACQEIKDRILEAVDGVPEETRQHRRAGLTSFERILPGVDRMYPDTDHPPLAISARRVAKIQTKLPQKTSEIEKRFMNYKLPADVIETLALSAHNELVDRLAAQGYDMNLVGRWLGQTAKHVERKGYKLNQITAACWEALIKESARVNIKRKYFKEILIKLVKKPEQDIKLLLSAVCHPCESREPVI